MGYARIQAKSGTQYGLEHSHRILRERELAFVYPEEICKGNAKVVCGDGKTQMCDLPFVLGDDAADMQISHIDDGSISLLTEDGLPLLLEDGGMLFTEEDYFDDGEIVAGLRLSELFAIIRARLDKAGDMKKSIYDPADVRAQVAFETEILEVQDSISSVQASLQTSINNVQTTLQTSINNLQTSGAVTKLGTATVGSGTKLWYLDSGSPKESSSSVGSTTQPVYLSNGVLTACNTMITGSSSTVGSTTQPVYLNNNVITAMSGALSTTYGGTGNTSGRATYANITSTNPTSATTYYIPFTTGITSGTNYTMGGNNGLRYYTLEGTTSAVGYGILYLGNSTASGTAANKYGAIRIYGTGANYWVLSGNKSTSSNYTLFMPLSGGCLVVATNGSSVGSATNPVYISSSGVATACNAMVPVAGATMTGQLIGYASTSYTTAQFRNIILTTSLPSSADNGTVCLIYE